jgi:hypothetical protein
LKYKHININQMFKNGKTMLITSIDICNQQLVKLLLKHDNIDLDLLNNKGYTAL